MAESDGNQAVTRTTVMNVTLTPTTTGDQVTADQIAGDHVTATDHVTVIDHVEARRIQIPAGVAAGLHVHNCPVVGNIVAGSIAFQIDGQPVSVLRPGDVFFEPEGVRIARFDALEEDATFLAYFLLAAGQEPELDWPAE